MSKQIWNNSISDKTYLIAEGKIDDLSNIYGDYLPKFKNRVSQHDHRLKQIDFVDPEINNKDPKQNIAIKDYAHHIWRFQLPRPRLNIFGNAKIKNSKTLSEQISKHYRSMNNKEFNELNATLTSENQFNTKATEASLPRVNLNSSVKISSSNNNNTISYDDGGSKKIKGDTSALDGHKNIINELKNNNKPKLKIIKSDNKQLHVSVDYINRHVIKKNYLDKVFEKEQRLINGYCASPIKEEIYIPLKNVKFKTESDLYIENMNLLRVSNPIAFEMNNKRDEYDLKRLKVKRRQTEYYSNMLKSSK